MFYILQEKGFNKTHSKYFLQNILVNMDIPYASPFPQIKSSATFILDYV